MSKKEVARKNHVTYGDPPRIAHYGKGLKLAEALLACRTHLRNVSEQLRELKLTERRDTPFGALAVELGQTSSSVTVRLGEVLEMLNDIEHANARQMGKKAVAAANDGAKETIILDGRLRD